MKIYRHLFLTIVAFTTLISCTTNEPSEALVAWKTENEAFFSNFKDSTNYSSYNIPTTRGGYSYFYKITNPGNTSLGSPAYGDYVEVNYRGRLMDGYVFDQTYNGKSPLNDSTASPLTFAANRLITGWTENLMQMKVGEIRTIVLPQELCYGTNGKSIIPPYSTLIFDVQLIWFGNNVK